MADVVLLVLYALFFAMIVLFGIYAIIFVIFLPFKDYVIAKIKGKDMMMVIQKDGRIVMHAVKFESEIYQKMLSKAPWSYLRRDATLYRLGNVKCAPVIDNWGVTSNVNLNEEVKKLADYGIETYEQMRNQVDREEMILFDCDVNGTPLDENQMIIKDKQYMTHAFDLINFETIYSYIDSVYPIEINNFIDKKITKFLEKFKLKTVEKNNSTMLIIVLIVVGVGVIGMGILGAKLLGLF